VRVIVTGASGQLGRLVAEQLLERLSPDQIILVTRRPQALADLAQRGADVRYGDFDEPASLTDAYAGGDRMLLISTLAIGRRVEQHRTALEAAAAAGVGYVVYTSLTNPVAGHPCGAVVEEHRETEELLQNGELQWTALRNAAYAELQVPLGAIAITYGKLVTNAGDGRVAPISRSDCAAAAVAVLTSNGQHQSQIYEITGPQAHSQADIAYLLTEISGHPVQVVPCGDRKMLWGLGRLGTPKPVARAVVQLGVAVREGYFDFVGPAFQEITGRRARPVREVLIEHRGDLAAPMPQSSVAYG
jgi:NAD(P)H dehydrogenase (quinone)